MLRAVRSPATSNSVSLLRLNRSGEDGASASFAGSPPHVYVTCPGEDREDQPSAHSIIEPASRVNSPEKLRPAGLACVEMCLTVI